MSESAGEAPPALDKLNLNDKTTPPTTDGNASTASTPEDSGYTTPATQASNVPKSSAAAPAQPKIEEDGTIKTPFAHPEPSAQPVTRPPLTAEQETKYNTVLSTVKSWTTIPSSFARGAPSEPLTDSERMWLTRECLLRYLRATTWQPQEATKRLQATLTWRREYGVEKLSPEYISPENETGKQVIFGYDKNARPVMYQSPGKQNTKKSDRQIQHLVFMLERLIDMMDPGQETCALVINFKGSTTGGSPSVGQGKQTIYILQNHYPERLGKALISDLPWYITTFFRLISPFIDPVTREKMVFNPQNMSEYIPSTQLETGLGGEVPFVYDHQTYWPALWKLCEERRERMRERWEKGGKSIGEYEAYLRGSDEQRPVAETANIEEDA